MTACRQRQQSAALYRSCLLSVLVKSDTIGGLIECKGLVNCNENEVKWSAITHFSRGTHWRYLRHRWYEMHDWPVYAEATALRRENLSLMGPERKRRPTQRASEIGQLMPGEWGTRLAAV